MVKIEYIVKGTNLCEGTSQHQAKWLLIYCLGGKVTVNKEITFCAHEAILVPPNTKYVITSKDNEHTVLIKAIFDGLDYDYKNVMMIDDNLDKDLGTLLDLCSKYYSYGPIMQSQEVIDCYSTLIFNRLTELIKFSNRSQMVLEIAMEIITNFKDPKYTLEESFEKYPLSKDYIRRQFIKEQGISPIQFLTNTRISYAMNLLGTRYLNKRKISEIAQESGFSDQLYFSRVFHKVTGQSPREYSDAHKGEILEY